MKYASVCSGVEAASLAWEPLGFEPAWFSQYDPEHDYKQGPDFPSAVLNARWPHVPNLGDMTQLQQHKVYQNEQFDLLVGGTPCQDYSIAGGRKGLDGERGQLTLRYVDVLEDKQPDWFLWENVPGVISSNDGRDFGTFIHDLKAVGYSLSWRIIDAQYCGVPQRRRRVFVVGHLGDDWRPSAAVLFERQSMPGYFKPSAEAEEEIAGSIGTRTANGSHWDDLRNPHPTLNQSNSASGIGASNQEIFAQRGGGIVQAFDMQAFGKYGDGGKASTVKARDWEDATDLVIANTVGALDTQCGFQKSTHQSINAGHILQAPNITNSVRRLTPVECERLQGMPEHHTNIIWKGKPAPAGQRYKAVGNSMAVPVMQWLGKRIQFVDGLLK